jgi:hypothetical protein
MRYCQGSEEEVASVLQLGQHFDNSDDGAQRVGLKIHVQGLPAGWPLLEHWFIYRDFKDVNLAFAVARSRTALPYLQLSGRVRWPLGGP